MNELLITVGAVAVIVAIAAWLIAKMIANDRNRTQVQQNQEFKSKIEESYGLMKVEFENLANKVFEAKSQSFKKTNQESIGNLLEPVKTQVKEFREKIETIHTEDTKQRSDLRSVIDTLKAQNHQLSEEANNLTKALTGDLKSQGDWGEMKLDRALEASGLQRDRDYWIQPSFKNSEGKTQRPDAVLRLPDNKHIVIDAKVSLSAYARLTGAESDDEREFELKAHCAAMKDRMTELAEKGYEKIPDLGSPEAVFMFIPIESALHSTLLGNPSFLAESLANRIHVVTPSTLIPVLTIVAQLWRLSYQEKNTQEIVKKAKGVHEKAVLLVGAMEDIGKHIEKTADAHEEAMKRLTTGRGNLIKQAMDMEKLGVSSSKSFPEDISRAAELEIGETKQQLSEPTQLKPLEIVQIEKLEPDATLPAPDFNHDQ